jgi:hypothetical protein
MTLPTPEEIAEEMYAHVVQSKRSYAASVGVLCAKDASKRAFRAVAKELQQMSINSIKGTSAQRYKQLHTDLEKLYKQLEGEKVTK